MLLIPIEAQRAGDALQSQIPQDILLVDQQLFRFLSFTVGKTGSDTFDNDRLLILMANPPADGKALPLMQGADQLNALQELAHLSGKHITCAVGSQNKVRI